MSTTLPISVPVKTLPVMVGGCQGTQFGCCPDGVTSKSDQNGSNCTTSPPSAQLPVGGCQGTQFGCCPDGVTSKSDQNGSNCTTSPPPAQLEPIPPAQVGGCKGTQFGCCPDGVTSKSDQNGSNCTNSNTTSNSSTDSTESIVNGYILKIFFIITITYFVGLVILGTVYTFDRFNVFFDDGFSSTLNKIQDFFSKKNSFSDFKYNTCKPFFSKMVFFFFVPVILALFYVSNTKDKNIFETLLMIFSIVDIVVTILLIAFIVYNEKQLNLLYTVPKRKSSYEDAIDVRNLTEEELSKIFPEGNVNRVKKMNTATGTGDLRNVYVRNGINNPPINTKANLYMHSDQRPLVYRPNRHVKKKKRSVENEKTSFLSSLF